MRRLTLVPLALALAAAIAGCNAQDGSGAEPTAAPGEPAKDGKASAEPAAPAAPQEEVFLVPVERWRQEIASPDPRARAAAADMVPADPGSDGSERLRQLVLNDPDAMVRERAVTAFGSVTGKGGIPFLKSIGLAEGSESVRSAALAELHRIHLESPEPVRGFIHTIYPKNFQVGKPFDLHVEIGSSQDVRRAQLMIRLPKALSIVSGVPGFRGPLDAGKTKEIVLTVQADGSVEASARMRLALDYPEQLDVEILHRRLRIVADPSSGTLADVTAEDEEQR